MLEQPTIISSRRPQSTSTISSQMLRYTNCGVFTVSRPVRGDLGRTTCFHGKMRISKSDSSLWGHIGTGVGPRSDSDWLSVSLRESVSVPQYRIPKPAMCTCTCGTRLECSKKAASGHDCVFWKRGGTKTIAHCEYTPLQARVASVALNQAKFTQKCFR